MAKTKTTDGAPAKQKREKKEKAPRAHRTYKPLPAEKLTITSLAREFAITCNSKAGLAIDMPAMVSCPGKTEACTAPFIKKDGTASAHFKQCYATKAPYLWSQCHYQRNMDLVERALAEGMSVEDIAKAIALAIRMSKQGFVPRVRIHGSGDIYSVTYCRILIALAKQMPEKKFWLYTRSWRVPTLLPAIIELARQPNVDVNLSADYINWEDAADVFLANPVFTNIACMQEENAPWLAKLVEAGVTTNNIVVFPVHARNDQHVEPVRIGRVCPSLMGAFKTGPAPCLQCQNICLTK